MHLFVHIRCHLSNTSGTSVYWSAVTAVNMCKCTCTPTPDIAAQEGQICLGDSCSYTGAATSASWQLHITDEKSYIFSSVDLVLVPDSDVTDVCMKVKV